MPGKSLNMSSASCHSHQKGIKKPKMVKKNFESSFTHLVHSNSFLQKSFFLIFAYHNIEDTQHQKIKN
jgi:hypothetical protein